MTSHYLELKLLPDPEIGSAELLGALYTRLHQAFVHFKVNSIGVSFPQYSTNPLAIGDVVRLHGTENSLAEFSKLGWMKGLKDHVRQSDIKNVPINVEYRTLSRKQFKTNVERLRRRRMRRKGETAEQAAKAIPSSVERKPHLPFVHVKSGSSGQSFLIHLELGPAREAPVLGSFNSYGLSRTVTVPWF
jgi:CRISPR-associated endonuclease Csy4